MSSLGAPSLSRREPNRLILGLLLLTLSGVGVAENPAAPGTIQVEFYDVSRQRPLATRIWYPSAGGGKHSSHYDFAFRARALRAANYEDLGQPRPLLLLSHGDRGSNIDQSWLAEFMAQSGIIVAALSHYRNTWRDNDPESTLKMWERPQDLSAMLDSLLQDPTWGSRINPQRIAVAGHSSGGYTALAMAGARYAPMQMALYCASPEAGLDCQLAAGARLDKIDFGPARDAYRDPRVGAAVALAPALGAGITAESLAEIGIPVLVIASADDEVLDFARNAGRYAADIPGARLSRLDRGGHFAFMPSCTVLGRVFTYFHRFDICGHRSGVAEQRPAQHQDIAAQVRHFLQEHWHKRMPQLKPAEPEDSSDARS